MKLVGNHNRCWIWGRHAVLETLRAGVWLPVEVVLSPRCASEIAEEIRWRTRQLQVPCQELTDVAVGRLCRSDEHQGLAAQLPEFPYLQVSELLQRQSVPQRWLVLDGIQDSFNFGAMIRSAVELGTEAVLIGTHAQSAVNSQVVRSSAGAINHLPIARATQLSTAIQELKAAGLRLVGASEKATQRLQDCDWQGATAILIGNEGRGISPELWGLCDAHVRIPTTACVGSLNAAVAAGIVCYERWRQCGPHSS